MTQPENGGTHRLPYFLPDGRHVLFVSIKADSKPEGILSLDRSTKQTEVVTVESTDGRYAAPGYLLFLHGNTLLAQSFDAAGRRTTGSPSVVAEGVISFVNRFTGQYSAIDAGLLVYQPSAVAPTRQLTLFGADGARLGTIGDPAVFSGHVFISPDGRQAAAVLQETGGRSAVWIYDLATGVPTRLAFGGLEPIAVAWAPDGKSLAFSTQTGTLGIQSASLSGQSRVLIDRPGHLGATVNSWSPDGGAVAIGLQNVSGLDVGTVAVNGKPDRRRSSMDRAGSWAGSMRPTGRPWRTPRTRRASTKSS